MRKPRIIFFDIDGTLIDMEKKHKRQGVKRMLRENMLQAVSA